MKERPILFSAPMVRAILDDRKTQTRRPLKPQPVPQPGGGWRYGHKLNAQCFGSATPATDVLLLHDCPYGRPGDRLWVRETWQKFGDEYAYAVTDMDVYTETKWRPSIHMPRAASRLTLEITGLRIERLHDITPADAIAEGISSTTMNAGPNTYYDNYLTGQWLDREMLNNPVSSFRTLWQSIHGLDAWETNPWVWVIEFAKT